MTHRDILKHFVDIMKCENDTVKCWFPNDKNSIRVRMESGNELIFIYENETNWRLETVKMARKYENLMGKKGRK